jgi:hypothetical protein
LANGGLSRLVATAAENRLNLWRCNPPQVVCGGQQFIEDRFRCASGFR